MSTAQQRIGEPDDFNSQVYIGNSYWMQGGIVNWSLNYGNLKWQCVLWYQIPYNNQLGLLAIAQHKALVIKSHAYAFWALLSNVCNKLMA